MTSTGGDFAKIPDLRACFCALTVRSFGRATGWCEWTLRKRWFRDTFYKGRIPKDVEAASRVGDRLLTAAEFAAYLVHTGAPRSSPHRLPDPAA
jgi:hypothetical protein